MDQNVQLKTKTYKKPSRVIIPIIVILLILVSLWRYTAIQRKSVIHYAEFSVKQMAEDVSEEIYTTIGFAKSSIKAVASTISEQMHTNTLENPKEVISPLVANTPFGGIEYIRADGMNVMNIGQPFDASDRVYYIEGIKGNTGIWNNYHPKTSQETLMNFYTPLVYEREVCGVITGYIQADQQIASLLKTEFFGEKVYGLLLDENDMVICSTIEADFVKDLTLDMFLDRFDVGDDQKKQMKSILAQETEGAVAFQAPDGEGRICVATVPNMQWRVAVIIPAVSFQSIMGESTRNAIVIAVVIGLILTLYATYILIKNARMRKEIAEENVKLEKENRLYNEQNAKAFKEISEIRNIIASANMGTWRIELVKKEEPRMYVDDKMKELLGIEGQEHTPEETYYDWFSRIKPEAVESVLQSVARMQEGYQDENTYLWIHPVKGERYVRCGGNAYPIAGGYELRGYHYDVDEVVRADQEKALALQDAYDAAEAANHAKSDFLQTMSHDIRTPMNGIIGMTAIADANIDDKERVKDCLHKISSASKHLLSLINEVLDMSKIESGKVALTEEEFNLSDLIDNMLTLVRSQIQEYEHDLQIDIQHVEHEKVIGDPLRIQQVFTNIMGNAIKYTPRGGKISVSIKEKPSYQVKTGCYEFIFKDNGIGMSEEYIAKIFEPFTRAEDGRISKIQGTGLGMPISNNIVRMMGGNIKVDSKIDGGSVFTVTIFLKLQEDRGEDYSCLAGIPVLVVDDDELSLESAVSILEDIGMKSEGVSSGIEAIERVRIRHEKQDDYFAVITDWIMPDMDGIETAKEIRKAVGDNTPIIVVSAFDWSDIENEAKAAGVTTVISKPLFKSRLVGL